MLQNCTQILFYVIDFCIIFVLFLQAMYFPCFSVPSFKNLPEETVSKIADVLEEVGARLATLGALGIFRVLGIYGVFGI